MPFHYTLHACPLVCRVAILLVWAVVAWASLFVSSTWANQPPSLPTLKAAVLKFGTVSWELQTLQQQCFDRAAGFQLQQLPLASLMATQTALKSGEVDVIVADWLWVARQRAEGDPLQFIPFSSSVGKLMVATDAPLQGIGDLVGKRIGIAGGPLSKGWLLLQAVALRQGLDLKRSAELQFGAPPLLNAALKQGQLDAVVTFWHYAARLEAEGFRVLADLNQLSLTLGLPANLPLLGYVFRQAWAEQHPELVAGLQRAAAATRNYLAEGDDGWQALRLAMRAESDVVFERLRAGYLAGTPQPIDAVQIRAAATLFRLLAELGGPALAGRATALDPELFWRP